MGICASHVLDPSVFDLIPPDSRREALSAAVERDRTALVSGPPGPRERREDSVEVCGFDLRY